MTLLETTVVGSYPQPDWLVDRDNLSNRLPPRVRAYEIWRIAEPFLEQAQDDVSAIAARISDTMTCVILMSSAPLAKASNPNSMALASNAATVIARMDGRVNVVGVGVTASVVLI